MRADVRVLPEARHDVLMLLTARMPTPVDALVTAVLFFEEVERLVRQHGDVPPDAIVHERAGGGWWLFAGGVWLGFDRFETTQRVWLFRSRRRVIRFVAAVARLPAA